MTPSMSASMGATPFGCIWAWLARRRVTMASSAITRPYRSEAGSSWVSSAIAYTSGHRAGLRGGLLLSRLRGGDHALATLRLPVTLLSRLRGGDRVAELQL